MKFYLLQKGHSHSENALHVFNTAPERDAKTIECIFGPDGLCAQNDAEAWDKYREELNDTGSVEFEGDPGLVWFTAHPEDEPRTAEAMFADKDRFVVYIADVVNAARRKEGLGCINMGHAGVCYSVLMDRRYKRPKA